MNLDVHYSYTSSFSYVYETPHILTYEWFTRLYYEFMRDASKDTLASYQPNTEMSHNFTQDDFNVDSSQ